MILLCNFEVSQNCSFSRFQSFFAIMIWLIAANFFFTASSAFAGQKDAIYRGFNVDANKVDKQDINALAATGANIVRVSFHNLPMLDKTPPYAFNRTAMDKLDRILLWCKEAKVRVIVDPHTFPGMKNNITTMTNDPLWNDLTYHELIISFWGELARRYKDIGKVIFGYDLFNEPNYPASAVKGGLADWNLLAAKIIFAIRVHDKSRYLIIEPADKKLMPPKNTLRNAIADLRGTKAPENWVHSMDPISEIELPKDSRLIVSPHIYLPLNFTHQGVFPNFNNTYSYPSTIDGVVWNKETLRKSLEPVVRFQKKYNVPILFGEFSAVRWVGDSGNRYLRDLIDIFEENNWSWTYHQFRAAGVWDAEMSNDDKNDQTRHTDTPRMKMLRGYLSKNRPASL